MWPSDGDASLWTTTSVGFLLSDGYLQSVLQHLLNIRHMPLHSQWLAMLSTLGESLHLLPYHSKAAMGRKPLPVNSAATFCCRTGCWSACAGFSGGGRALPLFSGLRLAGPASGCHVSVMSSITLMSVCVCVDVCACFLYICTPASVS